MTLEEQLTERIMKDLDHIDTPDHLLRLKAMWKAQQNAAGMNPNLRAPAFRQIMEMSFTPDKLTWKQRWHILRGKMFLVQVFIAIEQKVGRFQPEMKLVFEPPAEPVMDPESVRATYDAVRYAPDVLKR